MLDQWVGAFACGDQVGTYAGHSPSGGWAFVLARGPGYFVDTASRVLLGTTGSDDLVQALYVPGADQIAACTFTEIFLYARPAR